MEITIRPDCEIIILGDFNICMKNKNSDIYGHSQKMSIIV